MQLKIAAQPQKPVHALRPPTPKEQIHEVLVSLLFSVDGSSNLSWNAGPSSLLSRHFSPAHLSLRLYCVKLHMLELKPCSNS